MKIFPVFLSGGQGKRLWPASTMQRPKPFLPLLSGGMSLFQHSLERVKDNTLFAPPWLVVNDSHRALVQQAVAQISVRPAMTLYEPVGRNTAPAIALAALAMRYQQGEGARMLVMPTDHYIAHQPAFYKAVIQAAQSLRRGQIGLFGVQPNRAETGYGYIESDHYGCVQRFIEKPDLKAVQAMRNSGKHRWNSGMFLFHAGTILDAMERHAPALLAQAKRTYIGSERQSQQMQFSQVDMSKLQDISIDYAVMELFEACVMTPLDSGWSDLGNWQALAHYYMQQVYDLSVRQQRPWGYFQLLCTDEAFRVKMLTLHPGARLSLQRHSHRAEHWTVLSGKARVECEGESFERDIGQSQFIPQGALHRLENAGTGPLQIIEVQTGSYFGEDDIERFEDDYGRAKHDQHEAIRVAS